jgi:hypothetical protein
MACPTRRRFTTVRAIVIHRLDLVDAVTARVGDGHGGPALLDVGRRSGADPTPPVPTRTLTVPVEVVCLRNSPAPPLEEHP